MITGKNTCNTDRERIETETSSDIVPTYKSSGTV